MGAAMTEPLDHDLETFVSQLRERLRVGAETYGNSSFERPIAELIDEVTQRIQGGQPVDHADPQHQPARRRRGRHGSSERRASTTRSPRTAEKYSGQSLS